MGIAGLLPLLKKASTNCNVRRFSGCTAAVDAYGWLHKGAFGCAVQLGKGEPTTAYVTYCVKYINILLANNIKPVLVLDGRNLPSKSETEKKRRAKREENRKNAKEFLRKGMKKEAWECFTRCVDVTPAMARELIKVLQSMKIDYIVAPYEADAQLAYLATHNFVDVIITEDSDLVLFGCPKIFFKMNANGDGVLFDQAKLHKAFDLTPSKFDFMRFRYMCILSGCDYLANLPGIGLGRAKKLMDATSGREIKTILQAIPSVLKLDVEVTEEYMKGFVQAERTFMFQLVFDTVQRKLVPLTPYTTEVDYKTLHYAGSYVDKQLALDMALGNVDLHTLKYVAHFDPDKPNSGYSTPTSIWSPKFTIPTTPREVTARNLKGQTKHTPTIGMQTTVSVISAIKAKKSTEVDSDLKENTTSDADLIAMYSVPKTEIAQDNNSGESPPASRVLKRRRSSSRHESVNDALDAYAQESESIQVKVEQRTPSKRRFIPFSKTPEKFIENENSTTATAEIKVAKVETVTSNPLPLCLIERNKVYNETKDKMTVKSQYFRQTLDKISKVKSSFKVELMSDEDDSIKLERPELFPKSEHKVNSEKQESQLSIYSIGTADDFSQSVESIPDTDEDDEDEYEPKPVSMLLSQNSVASAGDSTAGFPGNSEDDASDVGSPSLLKSPVRRRRPPPIVFTLDDDSNDKPSASSNGVIRSRLRSSANSSPSTTTGALNKYRKSPAKSNSIPTSFQSKRKVPTPPRNSSGRVGLSKKALAVKKDPKQQTIASMFAMQQKAKM